MLKTNSKQARANVRAYIVDNALDEMRERVSYSGGDVAALDDFNGLAAAIVAAFRDEYAHEIARRGAFGAFEMWAGGLALNLFDYNYNVSAVAAVGDILQETASERERYTERDAERLLTLLIWRELEKAAPVR